jgi:uncharacterized repeat protein (TIGR03803 family)
MRTNIKALFLLSVLIASLGWILAGRVTGQTFTTLYSFTNSAQAEFTEPSLILLGNTLYGLEEETGIFSISTNGSNFMNVYSSNNIEGALGLILSGNTFYGTAVNKDSLSSGTVFSVSTNGSNYTTLFNFTALPDNGVGTNSEGAYPVAGVISCGNILYGTTLEGGSSDGGTVFSINTNGMGFIVLHTFTALSGPHPPTNSDGEDSQAALILSGDVLYGTAGLGGASGNGTIFAVDTNGSNFTTLYSFTSLAINNPTNSPTPTNGDGAGPNGLILSGGTLYGTAYSGGSSGGGTVFSINTNGSNFLTLHSFGYGDGSNPRAVLILSNNTLYGTTLTGGSWGFGTVFSVNTNGSDFTTLYSFTPVGYNFFNPDIATNSDGAEPQAGLILSGNTLYGTTGWGGSWGEGTVFSISFEPQLTINSSGSNVILSWPTNVAGFSYAGYNLQSTINLFPAAWSAVAPAPVVVNGQNTVNNAVSGTAMFYRLSR